jgi:ADP-ribose pyrophosphatase YjhB (NUDIX family)
MKEHVHGVDFIGVTISFMCNDGKGNFVLHKRSKNTRDEHGKWDFGGGMVEFGAGIEESVLRELKEEYGVEGKIQEQLPAFSMLREINEKKTHWVVIPFFVKVDITKIKNNEPEKFDEIKIFTLDTLPSPLHPAIEYKMKNFPEYFDRYRR